MLSSCEKSPEREIFGIRCLRKIAITRPNLHISKLNFDHSQTTYQFKICVSFMKKYKKLWQCLILEIRNRNKGCLRNFNMALMLFARQFRNLLKPLKRLLPIISRWSYVSIMCSYLRIFKRIRAESFGVRRKSARTGNFFRKVSLENRDHKTRSARINAKF